MPKRYSAKEVVKRLKKIGFVKVSQKGSHIKLKGVVEGKIQTVIVPDHKEIAAGTLSSIFNQASIAKQGFEAIK